MCNWGEDFLKENDLYLTRQQVDRIINCQPKFTVKTCAEYFKDKDLNHIGLVYTVENVLIDFPEDILELYREHLDYMDKKYEEEYGKSAFEIPYIHQFTEEEIKYIKSIDNMSEDELDEIISKIDCCESNPENLKDKVVWW